jgi:transcriptional regulator with XRE-family HTH domain
MIGSRLRIARTAAGLSLRDLESKIDNLVSAQAIGKYERDEMMPGSKVLMSLANALDVSESYLAGQSDIVLEGIEFRKSSITSRRDEAQLESKVLNFLEKYLEIESMLQVPSLTWDQPRQSSFVVNEIVEGELAAKSLREHWNLGVDPVFGLAEFLEEKGIKVLSLKLPSSVSGMTCMVRRPNASCVPVVVINKHDKGERQRFTLAHEVAHMFMTVSQNLDEKAEERRLTALRGLS